MFEEALGRAVVRGTGRRGCERFLLDRVEFASESFPVGLEQLDRLLGPIGQANQIVPIPSLDPERSDAVELAFDGEKLLDAFQVDLVLKSISPGLIQLHEDVLPLLNQCADLSVAFESLVPLCPQGPRLGLKKTQALISSRARQSRRFPRSGR